jgi:broad specificity phosphatase PhoE
VETAEHLLDGRKGKILHVEDMAEIDYGHWIGKTFEEVIPEKAFHVYHKTPRHARAPGGEHMRDVYKRTIRFIEKIRRRHKKGRIAVVSHADVIKTVLVHYLGMDRNDLLKFRIDNASLSLLWFYKDRTRVMAVNCLPVPAKLFGLQDLLSPNLKHKPSRKK